MASQGGGIGRFARRQADDPTKAPAPAPAVARNEGEQPPASPNNDFVAFGGGMSPSTGFASFDGGGGMDNVGMFGGSFDMHYDETNETSYDYNESDFEGFGGMPENPEEGGSNDKNTTAVDGTETIQESAAGTSVTSKKTNKGPFQFRTNQGTNPAPQTSPPRPKTAAPPQQQGNKSVGFSMFYRKRPAVSQETNTVEKTAPANSRPTSNNGQSLKPTGASTPAPMTTVENSNNNTATGSTFTRVLPPPSIAPSKPLQTQKGIAVPSVTPKGSSNKAVFLPGLNGNEDFATPMTRNIDANASIIQKTGNMATTTFVTPESNVGTPAMATTNNAAMQDSTLDDSFLGEMDDHDNGKEADGFDDLLSFFLGDLRSSTDLHQHGEAELLNLEVDLSRAFARTLHDRSDAMDLLDGIEDIHLEADDLILAMKDF